MRRYAAMMCLCLSALASAQSIAQPLLIAHRGASGELPEHTLEAYQLAIDEGADAVEPDVVMSSDGVLVVRHEPMLDTTTDVAAKFPASRMRTRLVDGVSVKAYFACDFTAAEIATLRAIQPRDNRPQQYNGLFAVPTFSDVVNLVKRQRRVTGRNIAIYPEIKHSTFHSGVMGKYVLERKLLSQLHQTFGNSTSAPVFIQSFEVANLKYLRGRTALRLVQLINGSALNADGSVQLTPPTHQPYDFTVAGDARTYADLLTVQGLAEIRTYAQVVAPWKPYLVRTVQDGVDRNGDGALTIADRRVDGSTGMLERVHAAGLQVHAWTFRNDANGYGFSDPGIEMRYYLSFGLDGLFTDFPATAVAARALDWK